jgi:hypothetical protein
MVSAAKDHSMPKRRDHSVIRHMTAEIRTGWSMGERHHRARLAMQLQQRLLQEILWDGVTKIS